MDDQLMVVCGDKVYPSEYGTSYFATKLEKDIIFGSIFTAAPELIVSTNTAFKKIQQSTALAGVWDVEGLEALAAKQRKRWRSCSCQDCELYLTAFLSRDAD